MKNIFKFTPPHDNNHFKIEEPELQIALKHDKNGNIDSSLSNNLEAMKEFFHFPLSNDFKIRTFDITVNSEKYNAAICFYDFFHFNLIIYFIHFYYTLFIFMP